MLYSLHHTTNTPATFCRGASDDRIAKYAGRSNSTWPTFTGRSQCKIVSDLFVIMQCAVDGDFVAGTKCSMTLFLNRGLLVRHNSWPEDEYYFCLGQMFYAGVLLKAKPVNMGVHGQEKKVYKTMPLTKDNLLLQPVLDPDEFQEFLLQSTQAHVDQFFFSSFCSMWTIEGFGVVFGCLLSGLNGDIILVGCLTSR